MKTTPGQFGFLRLRDEMDFASAPCGCILERSTDGNGSFFLMCNMHNAVGLLAQNFDRGIRLLRAAGVLDMKEMLIVLEVLRVAMTRKAKFSMRAIYSILNKC